MAVLTAGQKREQFEHALDQLLQRDSTTSALAIALSQFFGATWQDVDNILSLTEEDIDKMTHKVIDASVSPNTSTVHDVLKGD